MILDNHCSHISLQVYEFCKSNGICVVTLPPHTSHKLQPLDLTFFGPLKNAFNRECDLFLKSNPHEKITMYDLSSLFNKSNCRVDTMEKGISGFKAAGIFPFNPNKFNNDDFSSAQEMINISINNESTNISMCKEFTDDNDLDPSNVLTQVGMQENVILNLQEQPSTSTNIYRKTFSQICPIPEPKAKTKKNNSRLGASIILTKTPMKSNLEEKQIKKKLLI